MKFPLSLLFGWRSFWGSLRQVGARVLVSSAFAMALGLVPLVVVLSIADGMIEGITARTLETSSYHYQLWPLLPSDSERTKNELREQLKSDPNFVGVWPEKVGFALAYSPSGKLGIEIRGIDPDWVVEDASVKSYLKARDGKLEFPQERSVWIGQETAKKLNVKVGDEIKILTTRSAENTIVAPRVTTVSVSAVISVGYQELDRLWVFVPLSLAQKILVGPEHRLFWGVKTHDPYTDPLGESFRIEKIVGSTYQVVNWHDIGRSQYLNYQATRMLLGIIMALILLVSVVNITTAMITMVLERQKEIAILKAVGASVGLIQRQFLILGFFSGLLGTVTGLGLGLLIAVNVNSGIAAIDFLVNLAYQLGSWFSGHSLGEFHLLNSSYYLESIPVKIDYTLLLITGVCSVGLALLASWIPAHRAAQLRPLEVLKKV